MVSRSNLSERSLTIRPAPSVSSRTTVSRRHRHHRSHHGGSSATLAQNNFPIFSNTGDVEIIIHLAGKEQRYLLHRLILSQCSGFFEAGTSEEWTRGQGTELSSIGEDSGDVSSEISASHLSRHSSQNRVRWKYELDRDGVEDDVPMLVQKNAAATLFGGGHQSRPPPIRNKPPTPQAGFFHSVANLPSLNASSNPSRDDVAEDILRDYDNLFRIFYNYSPNIDQMHIAAAYVECKSLINLADMYDAVEVVGPRIDHHLLQFQGRLWKQIAKYPPSYLKLGFMARSKVIFAEAMVHVVGQWPASANHIRSQLPEQVLELIEDKVDELEELKSKIEGKLFRLTLQTSRGERITPYNGYLEWTAVSLFRQWLAENTTPPPTPAPKDSNARTSRGGGEQSQRNHAPLPPPPPSITTGKVYRLLGTGGNAYLTRDDLKRFIRLQPDAYNRETMKRFERRIEELKTRAREITKPLMRNFLELEVGKDVGSLGYLTCTRIEESDFPWDE